MASAVELVRGLHAPPDAGPVTGDLFGAVPPEPDSAGELDQPATPRGRGRPPGARNRSTDGWARFLLTRYRSPMLGLAEIAQAMPHELQAVLGGAPSDDNPGGVTLPECLRLIMHAAGTLAPYLHQKQSTAIDAGGAGMLTLIIQKGDGGEVREGARILPMDESETKQYQGLENSGGGVSE
jgi:hypothetical protein